MLNNTRPPNNSECTRKLFSAKTYVVGTQKNRLNEMVLLSTQNIPLDRWVRK